MNSHVYQELLKSSNELNKYKLNNNWLILDVNTFTSLNNIIKDLDIFSTLQNKLQDIIVPALIDLGDNTNQENITRIKTLITDYHLPALAVS